MFSWFLFAFCSAGTVGGAIVILRDIDRGRVSGRGFGFNRDTEPAGYFALMGFNCLVVALLFGLSVFLGMGLLRHLAAH